MCWWWVGLGAPHAASAARCPYTPKLRHEPHRTDHLLEDAERLFRLTSRGFLPAEPEYSCQNSPMTQCALILELFWITAEWERPRPKKGRRGTSSTCSAFTKVQVGVVVAMKAWNRHNACLIQILLIDAKYIRKLSRYRHVTVKWRRSSLVSSDHWDPSFACSHVRLVQNYAPTPVSISF